MRDSLQIMEQHYDELTRLRAARANPDLATEVRERLDDEILQTVGMFRRAKAEREELNQRTLEAEAVHRDFEIALQRGIDTNRSAQILAIASYFVITAGLAVVVVGGLSPGLIMTIFGGLIRVQAMLFDRRAQRVSEEAEARIRRLRESSEASRRIGRAQAIIEQISSSPKRDAALAHLAVTAALGPGLETSGGDFASAETLPSLEAGSSASDDRDS